VNENAVAAQVEGLLAPYTPEERVRRRPADDPEVLRSAGVKRGALYRLVALDLIPYEKLPGATRPGQKRGTGRVFFTLAAIARWRVANSFDPAAEDARAVHLNAAAPAAGRSRRARVSEKRPSAEVATS
jgi:hypothetical protein